MEKEALLNIILNDLKEVELLINTFKNATAIDGEFLQLTQTKLSQIGIEVKMLEKFKLEHSISTPILEVKPKHETEAKAQKKDEEKNEKSASASFLVLDTFEDVVAVQKEEVVIREAQTTLPKEEIKPTQTSSATIIESETSQKEHTTQTPEPAAAEKPIEIIEDKKNEIQPEIKKAEKAEKVDIESKHTLMEVIAPHKKSMNETISGTKVAPSSLGQNIVVPISNIYKAIGINDKLLFQRELFENKGDLMNATIDDLNKMSTFSEAENYIKTRFSWNFDKEVVGSFLNIVKRRYL